MKLAMVQQKMVLMQLEINKRIRVMRKIGLIVLVMAVACTITSCREKFKYTIPLAFNNYDLIISKNGDGSGPKEGEEDEFGNIIDTNTESTCYIQVTSSGTWELELIPAVEGEGWCRWDDHWVDNKGKKHYVVKIVGYYEGTNRANKVRGTGTVWVPMRFGNAKEARYATCVARRVDTGYTCVMRIWQQ